MKSVIGKTSLKSIQKCLIGLGAEITGLWQDRIVADKYTLEGNRINLQITKDNHISVRGYRVTFIVWDKDNVKLYGYVTTFRKASDVCAFLRSNI